MPALESIDIGDTLPSLTIKNEKGEDVDVSTLAAEKGLVLFVVPKADTRGFHFVCGDIQGSNFRSSGLQRAVRPKHVVFAIATPTSPRPVLTCML